MSLLLAWSNDSAAHLVSDGLSLDVTGRPISTTTKKFFAVRSGFVGACGFGHLRAGLERRFAGSTATFDDLVRQVAEFVAIANRESERSQSPKPMGRPLGAMVAAVDCGRIRSANIRSDRVFYSEPGTPILHYCAAAEEIEPLVRSLGRAILTVDDAPQVPAKLREAAETVIARYGAKCGGEIFAASLDAAGCHVEGSRAVSPPVKTCRPHAAVWGWGFRNA